MKKNDNNEELDRQLSALMGDPETADGSELDDVADEYGSGADLVGMAYELALRSAQKYRLAGRPVPDHVNAAIAQMKKSTTLEGTPTSKLNEIVESVLKPFKGPTTKLAFNHHRLTEKSEKDEKILDQLADEVKEDWTEED